jgi:MCP family monocarboxylic acid transporter-like MFS transporter 10
VSGIAIIVLSILLTSQATTPWQIVLSQGLLFCIGGIMLNFVHVSIFAEWFEAKKSTAMGIIWLGWRVGGLSLPLVCQWLLDNKGYNQTMMW